MSILAATDFTAIGLSLEVAMLATLLTLPCGFVVAWLLTFVPFRGKVLLEVLVNLPLTLPPVVVGYLLLLVLGKHGWLGGVLDSLGIHIIFTLKAAILASALVGFPLLVRSIRIVMEGIDRQLLEAARTLGATWYDTVFSIVLPLSVPGLAAGALLMFARSMGEFGATIIVAGNIPGRTQTIPLAIYDYAAAPGSEGAALFLCLIALVISAGVLLCHEGLVARLSRRR